MTFVPLALISLKNALLLARKMVNVQAIRKEQPQLIVQKPIEEIPYIFENLFLTLQIVIIVLP